MRGDTFWIRVAIEHNTKYCNTLQLLGQGSTSVSSYYRWQVPHSPSTLTLLKSGLHPRGGHFHADNLQSRTLVSSPPLSQPRDWLPQNKHVPHSASPAWCSRGSTFSDIRRKQGSPEAEIWWNWEAQSSPRNITTCSVQDTRPPAWIQPPSELRNVGVIQHHTCLETQ